MSHDNDRNILRNTFDGLRNLVLGLVIQRAGSLIKDEHARVTIQSTGDTQTLLLATRQTGSVVANLSFQAILQGIDDLSQSSHLEAVLDAFHVNFFGQEAKSNRFQNS